MPKHGAIVPDPRMRGRGYIVGINLRLTYEELQFLDDVTADRKIGRATYMMELLTKEIERSKNQHD